MRFSLCVIIFTYLIVAATLATAMLFCIYKVLTVNDIVHSDRQPLLEMGSLKSGDLISVSYNDVRKLMSTCLYSSKWIHVGIVYVDPETKEVFILEAANYRPPYNGTLVKIPFLYWGRININSTIGIIKLNKELENPENLLIEFEKYEEMDFGIESLDFTWFRFLEKKTLDTVPDWSIFAPEERRKAKAYTAYKNRTRPFIIVKRYVMDTLDYFGLIENPKLEEDCKTYMLTCGEITIDIMQKVGVFSKDYTPCSFLPSEITDLKVPTENGYSYSSPEVVNIKWLVGDPSRYL